MTNHGSRNVSYPRMKPHRAWSLWAMDHVDLRRCLVQRLQRKQRHRFSKKNGSKDTRRTETHNLNLLCSSSSVSLLLFSLKLPISLVAALHKRCYPYLPHVRRLPRPRGVTERGHNIQVVLMSAGTKLCSLICLGSCPLKNYDSCYKRASNLVLGPGLFPIKIC